MEYFAQLLLNGLTIGAIYALAAVAFSLVYGVVRMVNFAFGEFFMLGAFITVSLMLDQISLFGFRWRCRTSRYRWQLLSELFWLEY
ncbi:hypothetical protein P4054_08715 [Pseudomonas aeruginosa]|nr:hypothetical protein [Pseudomonas aeruginosa]